MRYPRAAEMSASEGQASPGETETDKGKGRNSPGQREREKRKSSPGLTDRRKGSKVSPGLPETERRKLRHSSGQSETDRGKRSPGQTETEKRKSSSGQTETEKRKSSSGQTETDRGKRSPGQTETEKRKSSSGQRDRKSSSGNSSSGCHLDVEGGRVGRVGELQNGERERGPRSREGSPVVIQHIPRSPRLSDGRGPKKLILHVDLRNTILVADSVTNVAVEQALNSFLTGATWGREDEEGGRWVWDSDAPSLKPPCDGSTTYYKFLERQLVRTPSERTALRLATGDFTSTPIGTIFRPHFKRHLASLKWHYPQEEERSSGEHKALTMSGSDGQQYHYILAGLYRLLRHLVESHRDFALVIRTYGLDAPNALGSLSHGLSGHHPGIPRALHVPVNRTTGRIARPARDVIVLEAFRPDSSCELLCKLTHERDIYRFLSNAQGVSGYKDDFSHWQDSQYNHHAGKPLWIDPYDTHHHHVIFDDNFRALDEDSIVDVRVFSQEESTRAYSLSKTQLSRLEDVCLVQADLLQSIEDHDYFLRKVELCEANYSRMLKTNTFPS